MKIGFSGHQDIPPEALRYVKKGIADIISQVKEGLVGISALAAGADQLFASLILEQGGRLRIIIPCQGYETIFDDNDDLERFHLILGKVDKVETLDHSEPSEDAFLDAGHRIADRCDFLIAVWDGKPARGKGGTGDIVEYARSRGITVKVVWPQGITR